MFNEPLCVATMTPMKLLSSISPVISLASIFILSFGFYSIIEYVFSCLNVVPCSAIKLLINGHMREHIKSPLQRWMIGHCRRPFWLDCGSLCDSSGEITVL
jgi:hypothetical protein